MRHIDQEQGLARQRALVQVVDDPPAQFPFELLVSPSQVGVHGLAHELVESETVTEGFGE